MRQAIVLLLLFLVFAEVLVMCVGEASGASPAHVYGATCQCELYCVYLTGLLHEPATWRHHYVTEGTFVTSAEATAYVSWPGVECWAYSWEE